MTELSPTGDGWPQADHANRRSGRSNWLGRTLAVIGGMRSDLVDHFPSERRDFIQVAILLFVTALEAFLSGALLVNLALSKSGEQPPALWILLLSGLAWAFVICAINRALVLSIQPVRRGRALVRALIGMMVATLMGVVISTPLVLQVFQPEIEAKLALMNQERVLDGRDLLKPYQEAVTQAADEVDKRRAELQVARSGSGLELNPAYNAAVDAWKQATDACTKAQAKATLELRGILPASEGGSGTPGAAPIYQALQKQADAACKFADDKAKDVEVAKQAAQRTPEEQAAATKAAQDALTSAQERLEQARRALDDAESRLATSANDDGLLRRLEALAALTNDNPTAGAVHLSLMAMLGLTEVLPFLFVLLKQWGAAPTAYELVGRESNDAPDAPQTDERETPHD